MHARFRFRHFQSRLLVYLLLPLVAVLGAVYLAVTRANTANALEVITDDLQRGAANFTATIASRNETLAIAGDALSTDYAFKTVYDTHDHPTILSALDNLLGRLVNADFMALVSDADNAVVADTRRPQLTGATPEWQALIAVARELDRQGQYPEAADILILDELPYHLSILPFLTPDLEAWVTLGFELNQRFTEEFRDSIAAEVSVLFRNAAGEWRINGSTMDALRQQQLQQAFASSSEAARSGILMLGDEDYVTLTTTLGSGSNAVDVVLQRSLAEQLAPFDSLRQTLFTIFAFGLIVLALGLIAISRTVTHPVLQLAQAARRIEAGDYRQRDEPTRQDEIGTLALAFRGMARGLEEKDKVRDLLGKVVSPEIAAELLSKNIELGGEEREVTVLFADVRGFTSLCEGQPPREILSLLNEYFSAIAACIEGHDGVIDKFIGDAVMALFGAPVARAEAPANAISAALAMYRELEQVNAGFRLRGLKPIGIGVGINTGRVVAGNMGSSARLNYTVIGDGVNLASRLEGLTKRYGARIIVSAATCEAAPAFLYQELDKVRVMGKRDAVRIYEPLMPAADATPALLQFLARFNEFLQAYRSGAFAEARALLDACSAAAAGGSYNTTLLALYQDRLQNQLSGPPSEWDGVHAFTEK